MQETAIEVHDLHKSYEGQPVLSGVSFEVRVSEIFGIAGRNGAGKTTAVEILQGLRSRDSGRVEVLGLDPGRDRKRLRPLLGAQLQTSALPERLRVGEALRLFARLAGVRVDWRELADAWRLGPQKDKSFGNLSGGQRQRLFLALAMVTAAPQLQRSTGDIYRCFSAPSLEGDPGERRIPRSPVCPLQRTDPHRGHRP